MIRELTLRRLPAQVRERLGAILLRGAAPQPLISAVTRRWVDSVRAWTGIALAAAVIDAAAWLEGFGGFEGPFAVPRLSPLSLAAAHGAALATFAFATWMAIQLARSGKAAPWPTGKHLFELDLVEVEGTSVRATALDTLAAAEVLHESDDKIGTVVLRFADGHQVKLGRQVDAESTAAAVMSAVKAAQGLMLPGDQPRLERIDPFHELRLTEEWTSAAQTGTVKGRAGAPATRPWLPAGACLSLGLAAGGVMFSAGEKRLVDIDDARFEAALRSEPDKGVEALDAYLDSGGRHAEEAERALFERRKAHVYAMAGYIERGGRFSADAEQVVRESTDVEGLSWFLGGPDGRARDLADARLFELAKKAGSPASYRGYSRLGGRRREEAVALEQEAAFVATRSVKGSARALFEHLEVYRDSPHAGEVGAFLKELMDRTVASRVTPAKMSAPQRRFWQAIAKDIVDLRSPEIVLQVGLLGSEFVAEDEEAKLSARLGERLVPGSRHFAELKDLERAIPGEVGDRLQQLFPGGLATVGSPQAAASRHPRIELHITVESDGTTIEAGGYHFTRFHLHVRFQGYSLDPEASWIWGARTPLDAADLSDLAAPAARGVTATGALELGDKIYARMRMQAEAAALALIEERM